MTNDDASMLTAVSARMSRTRRLMDTMLQNGWFSDGDEADAAEAYFQGKNEAAYVQALLGDLFQSFETMREPLRDRTAIEVEVILRNVSTAMRIEAKIDSLLKDDFPELKRQRLEVVRDEEGAALKLVLKFKGAMQQGELSLRGDAMKQHLQNKMQDLALISYLAHEKTIARPLRDTLLVGGLVQPGIGIEINCRFYLKKKKDDNLVVFPAADLPAAWAEIAVPNLSIYKCPGDAGSTFSINTRVPYDRLYSSEVDAAMLALVEAIEGARVPGAGNTEPAAPAPSADISFEERQKWFFYKSAGL